jgi:hypothetical protein
MSQSWHHSFPLHLPKAIRFMCETGDSSTRNQLQNNYYCNFIFTSAINSLIMYRLRLRSISGGNFKMLRTAIIVGLNPLPTHNIPHLCISCVYELFPCHISYGCLSRFIKYHYQIESQTHYYVRIRSSCCLCHSHFLSLCVYHAVNTLSTKMKSTALGVIAFGDMIDPDFVKIGQLAQ